MASYERTVRVDAPLAEVWAFHSTVDGLLAITPDWLNLRVDALRRPDGEGADALQNEDRNADVLLDEDQNADVLLDDPRSNVLTPGTRIRLSVRPLGVGPRRRWTSRIVAREARDGSAHFADVMEDGPVREWRHDHWFHGDGDETLVRDRVTYRTPAGRVGDCLVDAVLEPAFRYRHRRTREMFGVP